MRNFFYRYSKIIIELDKCCCCCCFYTSFQLFIFINKLNANFKLRVIVELTMCRFYCSFNLYIVFSNRANINRIVCFKCITFYQKIILINSLFDGSLFLYIIMLFFLSFKSRRKKQKKGRKKIANNLHLD